MGREVWVVEARPDGNAEWSVGIGFGLRALTERHMAETQIPFAHPRDGIECRIVRYTPAPEEDS